MKKIFIFVGHPDKISHSSMFADAYEVAAKTAGYDVRRMDMADMDFDPSLKGGFRGSQVKEPVLQSFEDNITWCEHFVVAYPTWWGSIPGAMKGLLDRALRPHFAYKFKKFGLWEKLLKGRTARIFTTMGSKPWQFRLLFGNPTNTIDRTILRFCGFKTKVTKVGKMAPATPEKEAYIKKLGTKLGTLGE